MLIIRLMGGLGNQMFQYAFAQAYAIKNNCNILIDLSWFEENKNYTGPVDKRVYELGCFSIKPNFATDEEVKKCINKRKKHLPSFMCKMLKCEKYTDNIFRDKHACVFQEELLKLKNDAYFEGYFQSEKYFTEYRDEIISSFTLNRPLNKENMELIEKIKSTNAVSIHVRRGDYVKLQDFHGLCSLEYYKKAIDYIASKIENPHFYLFSDDIQWTKENLTINYPYTVVNINDAGSGFFDMELMKNCKYNIIANSSFSWWGAWLNQNPDKIVIAPKRWFANDNMRDNDIIPERWIKI